MRRWTVRTHLAGLVALAAATCARGERAPAAGPAVIDDAHRRVTLAVPARRIVPLLPSFTELLFAIGAGSFLDRLAGLAGAHNVFHDIATPSAQVSIETIAARNPDFIAVLSDTAAPPRYAGRPEWRVVPAVRKGRFLVLPGGLFGRPGPRAAEAVRELRRRLETTP